jgi:hypothetical protein
VCGFVLLLASSLIGCDRWPFKGEARVVRSGMRESHVFDRGPRGCETACAMASASRHELSLLFGVEELPPHLVWGRIYVDGPGFKAFRMCIGDDAPEGDLLEHCFEKAHKTCVIACMEGETKLEKQRLDRHSKRDLARQKARAKSTAP